MAGFTQVSVCSWCGKEEALEFEQQPDDWVLAPSWYRVTGGFATGVEFHSHACLTAWVLAG